MLGSRAGAVPGWCHSLLPVRVFPCCARELQDGAGLKVGPEGRGHLGKGKSFQEQTAQTEGFLNSSNF